MPRPLTILAAAVAYLAGVYIYFFAGPFRAIEDGWSYDAAFVCFGLLHVAAGALSPHPIMLIFPLFMPWILGTFSPEGLGYFLLLFMPVALVGAAIGFLLRRAPSWWSALSE